MQKSWLCNRSSEFTQCLQSFLEEVDSYLDDAWISRVANTPEIRDSGEEDYSAQEILDMERFMDELTAPETKKYLRRLRPRK